MNLLNGLARSMRLSTETLIFLWQDALIRRYSALIEAHVVDQMAAAIERDILYPGWREGDDLLRKALGKGEEK